MTYQPLVSIVIPTCNSARYLERCLQSIRSQTYENIEVIIVDGCSIDKTLEIGEKYNAKTICCSAIRSRARNMGVALSRGQFVLSLDSDMVLAKNVIAECVEKAVCGFDAIVIPEVSVGVGFWAKCKALEKLCYLEDNSIEASRFFRRSVFERVGRYDPQLEAGEDWDIHQRISMTSGRVCRVLSCIEHDEGNLRLRSSMLKKYYYSKTLRRYISKHPDKARKQLRIIRPAFLRNWRKLIRDPVHAIGLFALKGCELAAIEIGSFGERI